MEGENDEEERDGALKWLSGKTAGKKQDYLENPQDFFLCKRTKYI